MKSPITDPFELFSRLQNRREFLMLLGKGMGYSALASTLGACSSSGNSSNGNNKNQTGATESIPAASLEYNALKRTSYGVHRDELDVISTMGVTAYLEQQLDYTSIPQPDLESDIASLFPSITKTPAELIGGFPDNIGAVALDMTAAVHYRQIFSKHQLFEVMVEFWTNHFNIHLLNGLGPTLKPADDMDVIRPHALGNFRDLLHATAKSPAMLFYLDNFYNIAAAPNENYARELMELHTLGVDGGYDEDDIKEVARCFTGWSIRFPGDPSGDYGTFVFQASEHDTGGKTVMNLVIPAGGGQDDGEQVLDYLAGHPSTAKFIATKLCRRFINDTPNSSTVNAVANAFMSSDGDIKETLRALFATDAFNNTHDKKFTRPAEYLAATVRALAPDSPYPTDNGNLLFFAQSILGQLPYYWSSPDGYPDTQAYWASTGGLLSRWRLSFLSYAPFIPAINVIDIDYSTLLNGADTLRTIINNLVENVLMRPILDTDRDILLNWLTDEIGVGEDETLTSVSPQEIAPLVSAVLLSSAYFHLR